MINLIHPKTAHEFSTTSRVALQGTLDNDNTIRKAEQEKAYFYYVGDRAELLNFVTTTLEKTWERDTVASMPKTLLNVTKRIIDKLTIIYKAPAKRSIFIRGKFHKKWTEYYNSILPVDVNKADKTAHRLAKLQNTVLPHIIYDTDTQKFKQKTLTSSLYDVTPSDKDSLKADKISYDKYMLNNAGEQELYKVVYSNSKIYKEDSDGNRTNLYSQENPFGIIPFVIFRLRDYNDFWGQGESMLIEENEVINLLLTKLNYDDIILGTAGALFGINLGDVSQSTQKNNEQKETRSIKAGRSNIINVETEYGDKATPDLKYVSTNPQISSVSEAIDWKIRTLATMYGLNPNAFSSSLKVESGFSRSVAMADEFELKKDDLDACLRYEQDRFNIIRTMNNVLADGNYKDTDKLKVLPDNAELIIDFSDVNIPLTQSDMWLDMKEREARGLGTAVDWMMKDNIDITSKEVAEEIINTNKEYLKANPVSSKLPTNTDREEFDAKYKGRNDEADETKKKLNN